MRVLEGVTEESGCDKLLLVKEEVPVSPHSEGNDLLLKGFNLATFFKIRFRFKALG